MTYLITKLRTQKEVKDELVDWKLLAVWVTSMKRINQGNELDLDDDDIDFFKIENR
jgi:hypothetical protein